MTGARHGRTVLKSKTASPAPVFSPDGTRLAAFGFVNHDDYRTVHVCTAGGIKRASFDVALTPQQLLWTADSQRIMTAYDSGTGTIICHSVAASTGRDVQIQRIPSAYEMYDDRNDGNWDFFELSRYGRYIAVSQARQESFYENEDDGYGSDHEYEEEPVDLHITEVKCLAAPARP